jgi:AcrR family transcriptional regulator
LTPQSSSRATTRPSDFGKRRRFPKPVVTPFSWLANKLPLMEAAAPERELTGEKAQRIVDAMRKSVAKRGAAGSTFEHVAREAGVSRGLLHYYFGTKERLLVEVVRRDTELRIEMLDEPLAKARTVDDVLDVLVTLLMDLIENEPEYFLLLFELFSAGRRNPDIQRELGQLFERTRGHVGEILRAKEAEGVLNLRYDAEAVTSYLFAVGDGFALQALSAPGQDHSGLLAASKATARYLLTDQQ